MGGEKPPHLLQQDLTLADRKLLGHPILASQYKWEVTDRRIGQEKEYTHIGVETAASLAALSKSKATPHPALVSSPLQFKTHLYQEFHTEPHRLPSAFSKQAPVLAEAGGVLSCKLSKQQHFLALMMHHSQIQAGSHNESATHPGVQGLLTIPFPW